MSTVNLSIVNRGDVAASGIVGVTADRVVRTRLRLTARGRRVLTFLAAAPAIVAVAIGAVNGTAALAVREPSAPISYDTVTVEYGDSLWSIAGEVAPQADPRSVVDGILRLNALSSPAIEAGQELAIPAEFTER